ncbi:MAG: hypothetical protein J2P54_22655, partial [Bradyrhizobiaceae bacterium]|nr:hypothetical protein [Bradyrhizobiaceae bacterium]
TVIDQSKLLEKLITARSEENTESYIERGRELASRDDLYLKHAWIGAMKLWSSRLADTIDHNRREDLQSEMFLRGYDPPFELAKASMETICLNPDDHLQSLQSTVRARGGKIRRVIKGLRGGLDRKPKASAPSRKNGRSE